METTKILDELAKLVVKTKIKKSTLYELFSECLDDPEALSAIISAINGGRIKTTQDAEAVLQSMKVQKAKEKASRDEEERKKYEDKNKKERDEANERLNNPKNYQRTRWEKFVQDILAPLGSTAIRTGETAYIGKQQERPAMLKAVEEGLRRNENPDISNAIGVNSSGGANLAAARAQAKANTKSSTMKALAEGLANTVDSNATQARTAEELSNDRRYTRDIEKAATGEYRSAAYWDLVRSQLYAENKRKLKEAM